MENLDIFGWTFGVTMPMQEFPELFSFAKSKTITLARAKQATSLLDPFQLPLSQQPYSQLLQLELDIQQLVLTDMPDLWTFLWSSGKFSAAKAYKHLSGHNTIHPGFKWIWHSNYQNKHKMFAWLIIKDRLSTRELLRRKNMDLQDYNCVLCNNAVEESLMHLMFLCPFAQTCWAWLNCHISPQADLFSKH